MTGVDEIPSGFQDLEEVEAPFQPRDVLIKKNEKVLDFYTTHEPLGSGKFGHVLRCIEKATSKELACKIIDLTTSNITDVENEILIMQKLQHPRLLQLYDAFQTPKELSLVMEYLSGGELFYRVVNTEYSERTCKFYLIQLCEAIEFMHSKNIIHLDLKPENILLVNPKSNKIKVIDFGLAREKITGESLKVLWGTAEFAAPEVINYEEIGVRTDMWSVGVITYILLSGLSPFMGDNINETYDNVLNVRYDFDDDSFEACSEEAKLFITALLKKKLSERNSATDCLQHKWLKEIVSSKPKDLNKEKLKKYILKRKWRRAIEVVIALQLMGAVFSTE